MTTITIPTDIITKTLISTFVTTITTSPSFENINSVTITSTATVTEIPAGDISLTSDVEQIFGFVVFIIILISICNCRYRIEKEKTRERALLG
jgi:hypothetical protein